MQYIKIGPLKIPYTVRTQENRKTLQILKMKIDFSVYEKNGKKRYKVWGIPVKFPFLDKMMLTQSKANFMMKDQLDDRKIREIATKIFEEKVGYTPNLDHPRSFNEKIFWMKLNYHNPMVTRCCDKYAVKEYVTEKLGDGYVVPTLASWDSAEAIDFSKLPQQYVLKVNWSSGYNIIVKDAQTLDEKAVREKVYHWMQPQQNSYYQTFNWGYKNMKPVVYAEQYMEQIDGQLYDYKFYCCNGKVQYLFISTDRHLDGKKKLTYDFYDVDFHHLDVRYGGRGNAQKKLEKPFCYDEMIRCAEILAEPFPFVRVDFYEIHGKIYVGEMTFYSGGGILPFDPESWDYKLGEYIDLMK